MAKDQKQTYSYYSRVLNKVYDSLAELKAAEDDYYKAQEVKEAAAKEKKADATKVEDAFKALNAARKAYKQATTEAVDKYNKAISEAKKVYSNEYDAAKMTLASAEEAYSKALKEFTDKHNSYHVTLKDGDYETTISKNTSKTEDTSINLTDLWSVINSLFKF